MAGDVSLEALDRQARTLRMGGWANKRKLGGLESPQPGPRMDTGWHGGNRVRDGAGYPSRDAMEVRGSEHSLGWEARIPLQ